MKEEQGEGFLEKETNIYPLGRLGSEPSVRGIAGMLRVQVQDLTPILCLSLPHSGFMLLFLLGEVFPSFSAYCVVSHSYWVASYPEGVMLFCVTGLGLVWSSF